MHYTVKYTGSKAEKLANALRDVLEYIPSASVAKELASHVRHVHATDGWRHAYSQGRFYLAFCGIQGFPVRAFVRAALSNKV